ncbi:hypothetical protein HKX48_008171 [Thoreauomyces humboldtii]|nr:hypothetical protein HKX48_008171 [Thoreauomyces humboldtii]
MAEVLLYNSSSTAIVNAVAQAGFYAAQHLLRNLPNAAVDMYEMLPIPYGLVRYGVAPDHPDVKNVIHKFASIAADPRFRFVGNMHVGRDVSFEELKPHYDAVILSYGASENRKLGLPHEDFLVNVIPARAFVGWYNGLPEYKDLSPDLTSSDTSVVIGQGNVALDVARTLLAPIEELAKTDITAHAVAGLRKSTIRHVHMIGRRGPLQLALTAKELREMIAIPDIKLNLDVDLLQAEMKANAELLAGDRQKRRLMELLLQGATKTFSSTPSKSWTLQFLRSPVELVPTSNSDRLAKLILEKNVLEGTLDAPRAVGTGEMVELETGLLLTSIGYKSAPLPGVPFDSKLGVVPNIRGKVASATETSPGLYVSGWLKRGPTGVLAATMYDAIETATSIIEDVQSAEIPASSRSGFAGSLERQLKERGCDPVSFQDWEAIDAAERSIGEVHGKPREKVVDIENMMALVAAGRAARVRGSSA